MPQGKKYGIANWLIPYSLTIVRWIPMCSRLRLIGPGVDPAELTDVGVAQLRQSRRRLLAAVPTAAVHQNCRVLRRDHSGGCVLSAAAAQKEQDEGNGDELFHSDYHCNHYNHSCQAIANEKTPALFPLVFAKLNAISLIFLITQKNIRSFFSHSDVDFTPLTAPSHTAMC